MKKRVVITLLVSLFFMVLVLGGFVYAADISEDLHLNIQTTNSTGGIVTGTYDFEFNISTTSDCSNVVYSNSTSLTTDSRGVISYYLEDVALNFSQEYYLCYYRGGSLVESVKIVRVPYAFNARNISASGIGNDSNLNLVNYNVSSSYFIGSGAFLTEVNDTLSRLSCGNEQVAKWNSASSLWECSDVAGAGVGDIDAVNTDGQYLTGGQSTGTVNLLLNESQLNLTIDSRIALNNDSVNNYISENNNSVVNWVSSFFVQISNIVNLVGNWSSDKINYYNTTQVDEINDSVVNWANGTFVKNGDVDGQYNSTAWNRSGTDVYLANIGDSVGIGAVASSNRLRVNGTTLFDDNIYLTSGKQFSFAGAANIEYITSTVAGKMDYVARGNHRFVGDFNGNDASTAEIFGVYNTSTSSNIFTILKNGKVGIGTGSPLEKLQVVGNILANGTINATIDICIEGGDCLSNIVTSYDDGWINSTIASGILSNNNSLNNYIDSQDLTFNQSVVNYILENNQSVLNYILENNASVIDYILYVNSTNGAAGSYDDAWINQTIAVNISDANTSMKNYVDSQDGLINISNNNYILDNNNSIVNYIDSNNNSVNNYISENNNSVVNYVNSLPNVSDSLDGYDSSFFMPLNTSVYGQFDYNGGWLNDGLSIIGGNLYAQMGYFYNISSLTVSNLNVNGSLIPVSGFDNQFDLGSSVLRWRDLFLGRNLVVEGDANVSGTLYVGGENISEKIQVNNDSVVNYISENNNSIFNYVGSNNVSVTNAILDAGIEDNWNANYTNLIANPCSPNFVVGVFENGTLQCGTVEEASESDPFWSANYSTFLANNESLTNYIAENNGSVNNYIVDYVGIQNGSIVNYISENNNSINNYISSNNGSVVNWANSNFLTSGSVSNSTAWNRSGTDVFLANEGDNVGIGTDSPNYTLEVNRTSGYKFDVPLVVTRNKNVDDGQEALTAIFQNTEQIVTGDGQDRANEVHLVLKAGVSSEQRRYIDWYGYDNVRKWAMGANRDNTFILYDAINNYHRMLLPEGGASYFSSESDKPVYINRGYFETSGTGGLEVYNGSSSANGKLFSLNSDGITQYSDGSETGFKVTSSGSVGIGEGDSYLYDGKNALRLSKGLSDSVYTSTIVGSDAGNASAHRQTVIGYTAGKLNTGTNQIAIGHFAGYSNQGDSQTAIGYNAGYSNEGSTQTSIGYYAGRDNTGNYQTSVGYYSGNNNSGTHQTAVGFAGGQSNTGSYQTAVGYSAGYFNQGDYSTGIGYRATRQNIGDNVVAIGYDAGYYNNQSNKFIVQQVNVNANPLLYGDFATGIVNVSSGGDFCINGTGNCLSNVAGSVEGQYNSTAWNRSGTDVFLANSGDNVGVGTTSPQNKLDVEGGAVIGATYSGTNTAPTNGLLVEGNVGIGTENPASKLDVAGDVNISTGSAYLYDGVVAVNLSKGGGSSYTTTIIGASAGNESLEYQTAVGYEAGLASLSSGVMIGSAAGKSNLGGSVVLVGGSSGEQNTEDSVVFVGFGAGYQNTGFQATSVGRQAGYQNEGNYASLIGYQSGRLNEGNFTYVLGYDAASENTGNYVSAIGYRAGKYNSGDDSSFTGYQAGYQNTGNNVAGIGREASSQNEGNNVVAIGYQAGYQNTGDYVNAHGYKSLYQNKGSFVESSGYFSGNVNVGSHIIALGYRSGELNVGNYSNFQGYQAGYQNSADNVVAIGYQAGYQNSHANKFILKQANVNANPLLYGDFATGVVNVSSGGDFCINGTGTCLSNVGSSGSVSNSTAWNRSGTDVFLANSGDNVGIGTSSPVTTLDVRSGETGDIITFRDTSIVGRIGSTDSYGYFKSAIGRGFGIGANGSATNFYIDNSENVGIGTTSPQQKLNVVGDINATGTINATVDVCIEGGNCLSNVAGSVEGQYNSTAWNRSGTDVFLANEGDNVGIGTTSPDSKFHVYQDSSDTSTTAGLTIEQDGTGDAVAQFLLTDEKRWVVGVDNDGSNKFKISESAGLGIDDVFTIELGGDVGIGTVSPLYDLDVEGTTISDYYRGTAVTHSEANYPFLIPYYMSDIAHLIQRGGSISVIETGISCTGDTGNTNLFDGESSYIYCSGVGDASDEYSLEIEFTKNYTYGNWLGFTGSDSWRAANFTIEFYDYDTNSWETEVSVTNYDSGTYSEKIEGGATGFDKVRLNFSDFHGSSFRLSEVYLINYNSAMGTEYFLSRAGGTVYDDISLVAGKTLQLTTTADQQYIQETSAGINDYSSRGRHRFIGDNNNNDASDAEIFGVYLTSTSDNKLTVLKNGNVGIGTTSPQNKFYVVGDTNATGISWVAGFKQNANYDTTDPYGTGIKLYQGTSSENNKWAGIASVNEGNWGDAALAIYANEEERVRIDSSGNVGIGTTSPQQKLNVVGDINATGNVTAENLVLENNGNHRINDNSTCVFIYGSTSVLEIC